MKAADRRDALLLHPSGSAAAAAEAPAPAGSARGSGVLRRAAGHAPLVLVGLAVVVSGSAPLAVAWCVASRMAYVLFVGLALLSVSGRTAPSAKVGAAASWEVFRTRAARLMTGDAVALGALSIVTRGTLAWPGGAWVAPVAGTLLVVLGVGTKVWATASLDAGTFYWRDFFIPPGERRTSTRGPYRWLANPMYTVGYAHAYGFALLLGSGLGLAGAAFAQVAILLLALLVERPHQR